MSQSVEIEYKNMLDESKYTMLCQEFDNQETEILDMTNYYFDTKTSSLRDNRIALRIRVLEDKIEVTLKTPVKDGKLETTDTFSPTEFHSDNPIELITKAESVIKKLRENDVTPSDLIQIGWLRTLRHETPLPIGLLAVDQSWYENGHDFELELEVSDAVTGKAAFKQLLKEYDIPKNKSKNKLKRMLNAKTD